MRSGLLLLCLAVVGCGQPSIDEGVPYVSAAARRARVDCDEPVYVDDLRDERYAVRGCGLLGVYHCTLPDLVSRSGDRFSGVRIPARCEAIAEGEAAYRDAVGAWAWEMGERTAPEQAAPATETFVGVGVEEESTPWTETDASRVRALLDELAVALLACVDADVLAVRASWDASCALTLEAPNESAEVSGCVGALAPTGPTCDEPGQLLHVVRALQE